MVLANPKIEHIFEYMFNPWGTLRHFAHIAIIWTRPHSNLPAATDGHRRIWIDPKLNRVERRCALTHELLHLQRGHTGCQPQSIERSIELEAARLLVRFQDLQQHASWALSLAELAEDLMVTEAVLINRFQTLDGDQMQILWPQDHYTA